MRKWLDSSDIGRLCALELRRSLGLRRPWRTLGWLLALTALITGTAMLLTRFVPTWYAYTYAWYAQPAGFYPQVPNAHAPFQIPLWAISPEYLTLGWALSVFAILARIWIAIQVGVSIRRTRETPQEEQLRLTRLSHSAVVLARLLAPALAAGSVAMLLTLTIAPFGIRMGLPAEVALRIWAEAALQCLAASALCYGVASRFRPRSALVAALLTVTLGMTLLQWGFGWLVHAVELNSWIRPASVEMMNGEFPRIDPHLTWLLWLAASGLGVSVALRSSEDRRRAIWFPLVVTVLWLPIVSYGAMRSMPRMEEKESGEHTTPQEPYQNSAIDHLALKQPEDALRDLATAEGMGGRREELRVLRVCALVEQGNVSTAREELLRMRPLNGFPLDAFAFGGGLSWCLAAEGRDGDARRVEQFWLGIAEQMQTNKPAVRPRLPAAPEAFLLMETEGLPTYSTKPYVPCEPIALRWFVARHPQDGKARQLLREQLLIWAKAHVNGYRASSAARRALLAEAAAL